MAQANSVNFYGNIYYILGILVRINMSYLLSAEFGGTMGLCLGASLLTIVELMDLFCYIVALLFKKWFMSTEDK